jgi:DNA polymerase III epsilon subunit-like protein
MDYMLDIETLGLRPGCIILSVGACTLDGERQFEVVIDRESCAERGLSVHQPTLDWWHTQDEGLRKKVFGGTVPLHEALVRLNSFIDTASAVWANGSPFDFPILREAYIRCGILPSWKYHQELDMRTLRSVCNFSRIPSAVAHDALADALAQAEWTRRTLSTIGKALQVYEPNTHGHV